MKSKATVAALFLAGCAAPYPVPDQQAPAIELAGRSPGPRTHCVPVRQGEGLRISENNGHVLVYGNGRTVWANFLGQCRLNTDDILVTEPFGGNYCRGDVVRTLDRTSRIPGPTCILSDFVPYTR